MPEVPDPSAPSVHVHVNGEPRPVAGRSIAELLADLGLPLDGRGVAVAIDGEVLARATWADRTLRAGERVEVLTAIQGG